jgi:dTDP-4-amino-4,6-dideoxygalactose transaminase
MNPKIWLSSPHMGGNELAYVHQAFETNWIAPLGPHVDGFEKDLQSVLGGHVQVAALNSGTSALHLALVILGVKAGDEVICQSLTFAASANPVVYQGATPVFVDSEESTMNISPEYLERAICDRVRKGKKPRAIVVVHLYGPRLRHPGGGRCGRSIGLLLQRTHAGNIRRHRYPFLQR